MAAIQPFCLVSISLAGTGVNAGVEPLLMRGDLARDASSELGQPDPDPGFFIAERLRAEEDRGAAGEDVDADQREVLGCRRASGSRGTGCRSRSSTCTSRSSSRSRATSDLLNPNARSLFVCEIDVDHRVVEALRRRVPDHLDVEQGVRARRPGEGVQRARGHRRRRALVVDPELRVDELDEALRAHRAGGVRRREVGVGEPLPGGEGARRALLEDRRGQRKRRICPGGARLGPIVGPLVRHEVSLVERPTRGVAELAVRPGAWRRRNSPGRHDGPLRCGRRRGPHDGADRERRAQAGAEDPVTERGHAGSDPSGGSYG